MKFHLFIILLSGIGLTAFSQTDSSRPPKFAHRNSVQFELFGHGLIYSANYERILINKPRFKTAVQAGVSYFLPTVGFRPVWIPVGINELVSFGKHHLEIGVGQVITPEMGHDLQGNEKLQWDFLLSGRLGYRYQKPDGRLIVRAGFTPFYEYQGGHGFHPSGGLAVGYSF